MLMLALVCAVIAALCTVALFQIFRGIKTKKPSKTIIGVILLLMVFVMLYFVLASLMVGTV